MIEQTVSTKHSFGLVLVGSIIVFLSVAVASGIVYFYKDTLVKNVTKMKSDLSSAKGRFEPEMIAKLKLLDGRLQSSNEVLSNHTVISPIFKALESLTLKTIRYTKFGYDLVGNKVSVKMSGQAIGYRSVALQADLFSKNKNLIDPVFSNLSLDDKGNVLFDLVFSVDPNFVDYEQVFKIAGSDSVGISPDTNTGIIN